MAPAGYSGARARKPGGGAGSTIRSSCETVIDHRVDVARQRAMDEADVHALLDLLDGSVSTRYGPIRQYCSGGSSMWSSIQPLPGVCSSGWLRKKLNRPPGLDDTGDLGDRLVDGVDVLEHEAGDHGVEAGIGERQLARPSPGRRPARRRGRGHRDLVPVGSTPTTLAPLAASTRLICPSPQPTSSTRRGTRQLVRREREDLLLVLGVGAAR